MTTFGNRKDEMNLLKRDLAHQHATISMLKKQNVLMVKANQEMKKQLQTAELRTETRIRMEVVREMSRTHRNTIKKLEEVYDKKVESTEDLGLWRVDQAEIAYKEMKAKLNDEISMLKKRLTKYEQGDVNVGKENVNGLNDTDGSCELENVKTEKGSAESEKDEEKDLAALRSDIHTKQARIDELTKELESYKHLVESKQITIDELRKIEQTDSALFSFETKEKNGRNYESEILDLEKQMKDLNEYLAEAGQRFLQDQETIENLKAELEKLKRASTDTYSTALEGGGGRSMSPPMISPTDFCSEPQQGGGVVNKSDSLGLGKTDKDSMEHAAERKEDGDEKEKTLAAGSDNNEHLPPKKSVPVITVSRASSTGSNQTFTRFPESTM